MSKVHIAGAVYVAEEKVCKYIEALQAENARFKKNYAIIEECAPPDWPRTDFVRHIFNLWSNGTETENKRLKEALQALYNEQNGPPLLRHKESWQKAMDEASKLLSKP